MEELSYTSPPPKEKKKRRILGGRKMKGATPDEDSFYGKSTPQLFFNEIAGFETISRPYLLRYGAPCHPDVIVRWSFANKTIPGLQRFFFPIAPFLVCSRHQTVR